MNLGFFSIYNTDLRAIQAAICIALFVVFTNESFSQDSIKKDSTILVEINQSYEKQEFDEVIKIVKLGSKQFAKSKNWSAIIQCQRFLYRIGVDLQKPKSIISEMQEVHFLIPDSLENEKNESLYFIASAEDLSGNTIRALGIYNKTLEHFEKTRNFDYLLAVYNDLGTAYTIIGDYSKARKLYNASGELNLRFNNTNEYSSTIYNLAENYYFSEDYNKSEDLFRSYLNLQPNDKIYVYYELSKLKAAQGQLDSARTYFAEAYRLNQNNEISETDFNSLFADILCQEGNIDGAINFLKKNETEVLKTENNRDKGKYFYKLADLLSKNNEWDQALEYFNKSLQEFTRQEISSENVEEFAQKTYLFHEIWIGDILIGLAKLYHSKFTIKKDEIHRSKAKECIENALNALDFKRSFFEDIESSIFSNKKSKALYEDAIDIYLEWYEECGKKEYLNTAFKIAQRHNAFILRQEINERIFLEKFKVEEVLKTQYLNQKLKVLEMSYALSNTFSQDDFDELKIEKSSLDSIIKIISKKYPSFKNAKNDFTVTSTNQIQKNLTSKKAVIKYFEGSSKLYTFVITENNLSYFVHENVQEIKGQIGKVRSILSNFQYKISDIDSIEKEFLETSFQLFENVLSKELNSLPKKIKNLVIIPTGSLTQIPFESLVLKESKSWKDPTQYLINDYAVTYNYFCNALTSQTVNKELQNVLSYGLEYDEYTLNESKKISNDSLSNQIIEKLRSEEMGHLYFADDEAKEVAEMFDGVSFINDHATKSNFLSHVMDYDIIHLSAHSFVDYQYPSNSAIIFSKKDSLTDNFLRIKDVDRLNLNGQLFTLSACNTFFGKNNEGEGLSSIARSFIQSGAGSVIGSFWSVPDEISKSFMVHFYAKLKQGMSKDEALRATKIDFMMDDNLSSPIYRSPAYWSAWVIYGDTQSIYESNNEFICFGVGLLFLMILIFIRYKQAGERKLMLK